MLHPTGNIDTVAEIVRHLPILRMSVDLPGRTDLSKPTVKEQYHPVGHTQRFLTVVGHQNDGHPEFSVQLQDQTAHFLPEIFVQGRKGFVQ